MQTIVQETPILELEYTAFEIDETDTTNDGAERWLWTLTDCYRAAELGLFAPSIRLELIAGELIQKMTPNYPHTAALLKTEKIISAVFAEGFHTATQVPIRVNIHSAPEPDISIVRGSVDDYTDHPTPADVALVIEISDTTARLDRREKASLYAQAGLPEYWMLVLKTRTLEVRRNPAALADARNGYGYKSLTKYTETDTVSPLAAPQAVIRVADLLPAA